MISNFMGGLPVKLVFVAGIISAVLAWDSFRAKSQFERGYFKAKMEDQQEFERQIVARARKNKQRLSAAISDRDKQKERADELRKELDKRPPVQTREIYAIDCDNICPDAFGLFQRITEKPTGIEYRPIH